MGWDRVVYGDSVKPTSPILVKRRSDNLIDILPIDEVESGMQTWNGNWVTIKQVIRKPLTKQMFRVISRSGIVEATEDHNFMVDGKCEQPTNISNVTVVEFPIENENQTSVKLEEARLLGFYCAEGGYTGSYTINNSDLLLLEQLANDCFSLCGVKPEIKDYRNTSSRCARINAPSKLDYLFKQCYTKRSRKKIPVCILNANKDVVKEFLTWFYKGDGDTSEKRVTDEIDQKSDLIAVGLQFLFERFGKQVSISSCGGHDHCWHMIILRTHRRKPANEVIKVLEVWEPNYDFVYDLEVNDNSHTFCVGKILVHNTDSVMAKMFCMPTVNAQWWEQEINEALKELAISQGIKIIPTVKLEKMYTRVLFKAKKRYMGWITWKDGKPVDRLEFKGIETQRSDSSDLTKKMLREFTDLALKQGRPYAAVRMVADELQKVLAGNIDIHEVAIPRAINKATYKSHNPWVAGRQWSKDNLGIRFVPTIKPKLLYCLAPVREVCITDDVTKEMLDQKGVKIDYRSMAEKTIVKKFEALCDMVQGD